jgi:hypothetical protein
VLPLVASIIVPPFFKMPSFSAASIIEIPMRSLPKNRIQIFKFSENLRLDALLFGKSIYFNERRVAD